MDCSRSASPQFQVRERESGMLGYGYRKLLRSLLQEGLILRDATSTGIPMSLRVS